MKIFLSLLATAALCRAELVDHPALGLRVERGYAVSVFSDEKIANDIWCMTLSPRGEVVVSGAGYIATLLDRDGDGRADEAVRFTATKGAMGLCFGETAKQLLVMADGWLSEYRDDNLDRIADGPPRRLFPFQNGEHGGHAIRRGPDGWWWVIGGNDAGITTAERKSIAGAIVRIPPDFRQVEIFAEGFRNPYDFDFSESGDVFTYDSDCERDFFLPWYSGTRVFHVQPGRRHGWRLPGYQRSFRVPDYMPEAVPALADLGRGSPTGVLYYKGRGFAAQHRGLFVLDWTFGKVWHLALARDGLRHAAKPAIFIEPLGAHGFAPTDAVETAEGAMLVSIGGRKTRGAVYKIVREPTLADAAPWQAGPDAFAPTPSEKLRNLAQFQTALGGWNLDKPSAEAFAPYEPANPKGIPSTDLAATLATAQDALLSLDENTTAEAARVLAMLEDDSEVSAGRILASITEKSTPTTDFHFLASYARLRAASATDAFLATAILRLDEKLTGLDRRPKQQWPARLNEVVARLAKKHPSLPTRIATAPEFGRPAHLPLLEVLSEQRSIVAEKFLAAAKRDAAFPWSADLVTLLAPLPAARPLLREQWKNRALRAALRPVLAKDATTEDSKLLAEKEPAPDEPIEPFIESLKAIAWEKGDAARGAKIFTQRACATCHSGTSPIGPDLAGPAARLKPAELLVESQFPSRIIADAFRATAFTMRDGSQIAGFVAFLSADGVIVQTPAGTTRLAEQDIATREPSTISLMPPGLLTGLGPAELADLAAHLRSLK